MRSPRLNAWAEMNYAGAGVEKNTKNAIFRRMKKRQTGITRQVAEKPEALNKLSSAYIFLKYKSVDHAKAQRSQRNSDTYEDKHFYDSRASSGLNIFLF